jgi:hypothetical protein
MEEQAKRISGHSELDKSIICYWFVNGFKGTKEGGCWLLWLPGCGLGALSKHKVEEHEDGTISVTPSIMVTSYATDDGVRLEKPIIRHGYLTKGMWNEC